MGEKSKEIDIAGRTPDGKLFMRKGPFRGEGLLRFLSTMITMLGPDATIGDLVHFKARQQGQETKKGTQ